MKVLVPVFSKTPNPQDPIEKLMGFKKYPIVGQREIEVDLPNDFDVVQEVKRLAKLDNIQYIEVMASKKVFYTIFDHDRGEIGKRISNLNTGMTSFH